MPRTGSVPAGRQKRSSRQSFRRRMRSGQTLVIFALSFTVLLGMAGLAIDVGRAYDLYAQMQRAAEAGALAGVLYMPTYYDTVRPGDTDSAVSRASKEVVKNGFGSALPPTMPACGAIPISVCQVAGKSNDLKVTVTQTLDLILLSGLGVQPVTLTATAQADTLPPVQLGARQNFIGDAVECTGSHGNVGCDTDDSSMEHLQSFMAAFNGPSSLKEDGDPFVYCEEGNAYSSTEDASTNLYTTYNNFSTNLPQYPGILNHCGVPNPGTTAGNQDQQVPGYTGTQTATTAHPGGYNYLVTIPSGQGPADIWVYNPRFIPCESSSSSCDTTYDFGSYDRFRAPSSDSTYYIGPNLNGIGSHTPTYPGFDGLHYDAPPFYYTITYTVYQVNSYYDRSSDTVPASLSNPDSISYQPYDALTTDLGAHCSTTQNEVYDPYNAGGGTPNKYYNSAGIVANQGCMSLTPGQSPSRQTAPAPCWEQWCTLYTNLPTGTYRLVVEATGLTSSTPAYSSDSTSGYGQHDYALKVCPSNLSTPIGCSAGSPPGLQIAAWNNMDAYVPPFPNPGGGPNPSDPNYSCITSSPGSYDYTCLDLVCFPTAYAGRTLNVQIFNPGGGRSSQDGYAGVAEAGVGTADVTYPSPSSTTGTIGSDTLVNVRPGFPTYAALHGLWLTASITLPSTYTGNCLPNGTGWWQMVYASVNGQPNNMVGIKVSLAGSPVHLVTPG